MEENERVNEICQSGCNGSDSVSDVTNGFCVWKEGETSQHYSSLEQKPISKRKFDLFIAVVCTLIATLMLLNIVPFFSGLEIYGLFLMPLNILVATYLTVVAVLILHGNTKMTIHLIIALFLISGWGAYRCFWGGAMLFFGNILVSILAFLDLALSVLAITIIIIYIIKTRKNRRKTHEN